MLDFPSSPSNAQVYNSPNGTSWIWDGAKWTSAAFTSVYTDTHYRNRIINGDMSVDQRNGGTPVASPNPGVAYAIDRWGCSSNSAGNVGQAAMGGVNLQFAYGLIWQTTTAHTVVAGDGAYFYQGIEGCNFNDAAFGVAGAQPVVLEFWVYSSLTGTFAGGLMNGAGNRSYVFTYSIPTANTWTKIRLTIPGDTAGTWSVAGNAIAALLSFNLGGGSNSSHAAGAWAVGAFTTAPGAINPVATLNANFYITGVALMVGAAASNAEPEFKKYSDNLIDCQRYCLRPSNQLVGAGYGAGAASAGCYAMRDFPVIMRAVPTVSGQTYAVSNAGTPVVSGLWTGGSSFQATNIGAGGFQFVVNAGTELYDADF
jgi:hypothetical protein